MYGKYCMSDSMVSNKSSDYGEIFLDLCDSNLRSNVVETLVEARNNSQPIAQDHLNEIAAYINQLEDALVRHHSGLLLASDVLRHLKQCTGLDVSALAYTIDSMHAEDA